MDDQQKTIRNSSRQFWFLFGFIIFPLTVIISAFLIFRVPVTQEEVLTENPVSTPTIVNVDGSINQLGEVSPPMSSSISVVRTGHSESGLKKSEENQERIQKSDVWQPTQYSKGDITRNIYIVQTGDTLWQIANAYYGDPFKWVNILEQNKDLIGYLPNGEQALILPGQILSLP